MTSEILTNTRAVEQPSAPGVRGEIASVPARILVCGMNYAPELTGIGRYTGELAVDLAAHGHDVEVVTSPPHYPGWFVRTPYRAWRYLRETLDGVKVFRCPILLNRKGKGIWRILAPFSLGISTPPITVWRILARRPQVILCVEPTLMMAPAATLFGRLIGARLVLHVQDLEVDAAFAVGHISESKLLQRLALGFERWLLGQFDHVVTVSNQMARLLSEKGVPAERLSVVRNWVNTKKIRPLGRPSIYRRELGLGEDDFIVLYAGQMGVKQALHVVFEVAERLVGETKIKFVIAGDGPVKKPLSEQYAHLPNITLLPLQPEERLCELLNLADCHILPQDPSVQDLVLPSKLGGMLASGKRILVTAGLGTELHEFLGDAAEFVAPGDLEALATRLRKLASDRPEIDAAMLVRLAESISSDTVLAHFRTEVLLPGSVQRATQ